MPCRILTDCLYEIFEFLEKDKLTLHSCLLVNRTWCKISVRILWRDVLSFKYASYQSEVSSQILNTLISCLPNESKELLHKNEIFISTPTTKSPLFNYVLFCKFLSIHEIDHLIQHNLENQQIITSRNLNFSKYLILQEVLKMFMKQIPSLKELKYSREHIMNVTFTHFPGAKKCLTDLAVLSCSSDIHSEFFNQLSQICCNIQSLNIEFKGFVSSELKGLISSQYGLKDLSLIQSYDGTADWTEIIPSLTKHIKTLIKLKIYGGKNHVPLLFINTFKNLQQLVLKVYENSFEELNKLNYDKFSRLEILKFQYLHPNSNILIKFLENNGKNLKEFHIGNSYNNSLNLAIAKFCPNLKSLRTEFIDDEIETLKMIFYNCQKLEKIRIGCSREMLDIVAKYSPKNFHKLKSYVLYDFELNSVDLELFFINWKNRKQQKSLTFKLNCIYSTEVVKKEIMDIIEKYKNLGIIKVY
ncbi:hypothetical protein C1645_879127 [Glomus cerebriforme]|uniref:F-box domain-containing protein n=1 Tax=Glomus cerebriforme TaxID=658196 RepID=A0A397SST8_9GLOM|nr:hypothetical protein C1645_879127 [Glomus cerebriforme]